MPSIVPEFVRECIPLLPPLPAAVQRIMTLAREPEVDFDEIIRVIESDQTLTARTLRAANSAFYGVARQIQTVKHASVLLGQNVILNLALSISVMSLESSLGGSWARYSSSFWRHSVAVGIASRTLAEELNLEDAEHAFVAGLLHDIGKLVLYTHFGDEYAEMLFSPKQRPLHIEEEEAFGIHHAGVGEALCMHWNLPDTISRSVVGHHGSSAGSMRSIPDVVRNANYLVKAAGLGNSGNEFAALMHPAHLLHNQLRPERLYEHVSMLPEKVLEAEEALRGVPAEAANGQDEKRTHVQAPIAVVRVATAEEYELLRLVLASMGFRPEAPNSPESAGKEDVALIITDQPGADVHASIKAIDYRAWRAEHRFAEGDYLPVEQLRSWLREELKRSLAGQY